MRPVDRRKLERALVWLIAIHGLGVSLLLVFLPRLTLDLGGFGAMDDVFFVRQGGVFHTVIAVAYVVEYERYGTSSLVVFAKAVAVVFLAWALAFSSPSPLIALALAGDFAMGVLMLVVSRWARLTER